MTAKKMNIILYFKFKASSSNIFCVIAGAYDGLLVIDILVFTSKTLADISRPSDKDEGGGGGGAVNQTRVKGGGRPQKFFFFLPFGPHFGLKISWGGGPPGPLPWIRY